MSDLVPLRSKPSLTLVSSAAPRSPRSPSPPIDRGQREPLAAAERRLLDGLAEEQAYAILAEGAAGLSVIGIRRGVSLRVASATVEAAQALVDRDLAEWSTASPSGRQRLAITEPGRAWHARAKAPPDVNPFLAQHRPVAIKRVEGAAVAVDGGESPLTWLATRKGRDGKPLVDTTQLQAGERLRRDLTMAAMVPRVTSSWSPATGRSQPGAGPQPFPELVLAARQRATRALGAVGPEFSGLLLDVCGFLKGLERVEAERGWPARSGKVVLLLALNQLARHYGLAAAAVGPARSQGLRHWGAEDYRPSIDGPTEG